MKSLPHLFENNVAWSQRLTADDPEYFLKLSRQQSPDFLWIGCADSRVPANDIVDLMPGELFVHRNVANLVYPSDLNCLAVIEFAVKVLKVKHIIVCGHYGCGGVKAALEEHSHGHIDHWLTKIRDTHFRYLDEVEALSDPEKKVDRMCELNVIDQVRNVSHLGVVQDAWHNGQPLAIHGWIYSLKDGLLKDLGICIDQLDQVPRSYHVVSIGT